MIRRAILTAAVLPALLAPLAGCGDDTAKKSQSGGGGKEAPKDLQMDPNTAGAKGGKPAPVNPNVGGSSSQ
jgi:hypothetical protein